MNPTPSSTLNDLLPWARGGRPQRLPSEQDRRVVRSTWKKSDGYQRAELGSLLAQMQAARQDYEAATTTIQRSRTQLKGDLPKAHALLDWAHTTVLLQQGQLQESRKSFAALQRRLSSLSAWADLAPMCLNRSRQMLVRGDYDEAAILAHNARIHAERSDCSEIIVEALSVSCEIALSRGKHREAELHHRKMADIATENASRNRDGLLLVALNASSLSMTRGLFQQSQKQLLGLEIDPNPLLQLTLNQRMAELHLRQGQLKEAELCVRKVLSALEAFGQRAALGVGLRMLGDIQALLLEPSLAIDSYILALQAGCLCSDFHNAKQACSRIMLLESFDPLRPRTIQFSAILQDLEELTAPTFELTR